MKLYRYILLLVIFVIYGCEQRISPYERNEENLVATNGYIFFDTERVTRGTPIENYLYEDFHVIGYQYSGEWTTVRPQTSQNNAGVFDNKPQLVDWDGSAHSYSPLKEWNTENTYSFFAWYPTNLAGWSGTSHQGEPYITYTLDRRNARNHVDVLTACVIDRKVNLQDASSKSVSLEMQHRLSALDIVARSYVNAEVFSDVVNLTEAKVKITRIDFKLTPKYDGAQIPLNTNDRNLTITGTQSISNGDKSMTFSSIGTSSPVVVNYYSSNSDLATITTDSEETMFLIPQPGEGIPCTMTVTYDIIDASGASIWNTVYPDQSQGPAKTQSQDITIKELQEGMRYYLLINITKSGITVVVLDPEAWEDTFIDYEFQ